MTKRPARSPKLLANTVLAAVSGGDGSWDIRVDGKSKPTLSESQIKN